MQVGREEGRVPADWAPHGPVCHMPAAAKGRNAATAPGIRTGAADTAKRRRAKDAAAPRKPGTGPKTATAVKAVLPRAAKGSGGVRKRSDAGKPRRKVVLPHPPPASDPLHEARVGSLLEWCAQRCGMAGVPQAQPSMRSAVSAQSGAVSAQSGAVSAQSGATLTLYHTAHPGSASLTPPRGVPSDGALRLDRYPWREGREPVRPLSAWDDVAEGEHRPSNPSPFHSPVHSPGPAARKSPRRSPTCDGDLYLRLRRDVDGSDPDEGRPRFDSHVPTLGDERTPPRHGRTPHNGPAPPAHRLAGFWLGDEAAPPGAAASPRREVVGSADALRVRSASRSPSASPARGKPRDATVARRSDLAYTEMLRESRQRASLSPPRREPSLSTVHLSPSQSPERDGGWGVLAVGAGVSRWTANPDWKMSFPVVTGSDGRSPSVDPFARSRSAPGPGPDATASDTVSPISDAFDIVVGGRGAALPSPPTIALRAPHRALRTRTPPAAAHIPAMPAVEVPVVGDRWISPPRVHTHTQPPSPPPAAAPTATGSCAPRGPAAGSPVRRYRKSAVLSASAISLAVGDSFRKRAGSKGRPSRGSPSPTRRGGSPAPPRPSYTAPAQQTPHSPIPKHSPRRTTTTTTTTTTRARQSLSPPRLPSEAPASAVPSALRDVTPPDAHRGASPPANPAAWDYGPEHWWNTYRGLDTGGDSAGDMELASEGSSDEGGLALRMVSPPRPRASLSSTTVSTAPTAAAPFQLHTPSRVPRRRNVAVVAPRGAAAAARHVSQSQEVQQQQPQQPHTFTSLLLQEVHAASADRPVMAMPQPSPRAALKRPPRVSFATPDTRDRVHAALPLDGVRAGEAEGRAGYEAEERVAREGMVGRIREEMYRIAQMQKLDGAPERVRRLRGECDGDAELLHVLVTQGDELGVVYLLERLGNPPQSTLVLADGATPLMTATRYRRLDVAKVLLRRTIASCDHLAELFAKDSSGWTVLHHAATAATPPFLGLLLGAAGDYRRRYVNIQAANPPGATALHCLLRSGAAGEDMKQCLSLLLSSGADVTLEADGVSCAELMLRQDSADMLNTISGPLEQHLRAVWVRQRHAEGEECTRRVLEGIIRQPHDDTCSAVVKYVLPTGPDRFNEPAFLRSLAPTVAPENVLILSVSGVHRHPTVHVKTQSARRARGKGQREAAGTAVRLQVIGLPNSDAVAAQLIAHSEHAGFETRPAAAAVSPPRATAGQKTAVAATRAGDDVMTRNPGARVENFLSAMDMQGILEKDKQHTPAACRTLSLDGALHTNTASESTLMTWENAGAEPPAAGGVEGGLVDEVSSRSVAEEVVLRFDKNRDGCLSSSEWNALLEALGSVAISEAEHGDLCRAAGLPRVPGLDAEAIERLMTPATEESFRVLLALPSVDQRVVAVGLRTRPYLNNKQGVVTGYKRNRVCYVSFALPTAAGDVKPTHDIAVSVKKLDWAGKRCWIDPPAVRTPPAMRHYGRVAFVHDFVKFCREMDGWLKYACPGDALDGWQVHAVNAAGCVTLEEVERAAAKSEEDGAPLDEQRVAAALVPPPLQTLGPMKIHGMDGKWAYLNGRVGTVISLRDGNATALMNIPGISHATPIAARNLVPPTSEEVDAYNTAVRLDPNSLQRLFQTGGYAARPGLAPAWLEVGARVRVVGLKIHSELNDQEGPITALRLADRVAIVSLPSAPNAPLRFTNIVPAASARTPGRSSIGWGSSDALG